VLAVSALSLGPLPPTEAKTRRPISLQATNPRYFDFRGKPAVLITSAEHYGAVLNLDFDYGPYLNELRASGLNQTRTFSGSYVEKPGAFKIQHNTLAPAPGRFICPWARSDTPGYAGGGNKLDLTRWNDAYFTRLKDFVAKAGERGVVVELVLFCPLYDDAIWSYSPLNAENNVNGIGAMPRTDVLTLKDPKMVAVHEALVRKIVQELKGFDNLYYEVCNEPYFGGVTREWQDHIVATIQAAEASFPAKHLIAMNIANGSRKVDNPNAAVSIFNFHYSSPPDSVAQNYDLKRVIGFDETGFRGVKDQPYRTDAWEFILAGGAVYSHLDYSFTVEHPGGTAPVTDPTPGGGGPSLRDQLATLKRFIERFDFVRMAPHNEVVRGGVPAGAVVRVLAEPGQAYAIYVRGGVGATLELDVPPGRYAWEWLNPRTGLTTGKGGIILKNGALRLESPVYMEDIALRIRRR